MSMLTLRIVGFFASLLLTLASYFVITNPASFNLTTQLAVLIILLFAIVQATVQVIFFLDLAHEKGVRWNLIIFLSTVSIMLIIVVFSIWVMAHLNYNMMPMT